MQKLSERHAKHSRSSFFFKAQQYQTNSKRGVKPRKLSPTMATLIAPENFSPVDDAENSVKGWGTDEKAIISILGHRNAAQRMQIRLAYEQSYQEDLLKRLESELSGDFERWILNPADRDAVLAHVAIKKSECNYNVIIEIATILSPEELLAVRKAYQVPYKHSLEEDLAAHTTGDTCKLLVALLTAYCYDGCEINAKLSNSEADILHDAIKDKAFIHVEVIRILSTRSKTQLKATFNRYRDDHGTSISKTLLEEGGDGLQKALHVAIRCLNDPKKYFEKVLRNAIKKVGTDEDALTRVIVTSSERDLKDIKEVYYKKNSVPLNHAVAKETSGDSKDFLLTLLGKED